MRSCWLALASAPAEACACHGGAASRVARGCGVAALAGSAAAMATAAITAPPTVVLIFTDIDVLPKGNPESLVTAPVTAGSRMPIRLTQRLGQSAGRHPAAHPR